MLAVGIHRQRVREAALLRFEQPIEHRRALASIRGSDEHAQARVVARHRLESTAGPVGTTVDDDPYWIPFPARGSHSLKDLLSRVVTRDDH